MENNTDFNTYEEVNIIAGKKVFNRIKKTYYFLIISVFCIYIYYQLYLHRTCDEVTSSLFTKSL